MISQSVTMAAVIVANWEYSTKGYHDLQDPQNDGELMENLLTEGQYENIVHLQNEEDIERVVKSFVEKQKTPIDRFHFHYSGLKV